MQTTATITTTATTTSPVGNYPIQLFGAQANNYAIAYQNGTLTIGKAALTITANNATKAYGQTLSLIHI